MLKAFLVGSAFLLASSGVSLAGDDLLKSIFNGPGPSVIAAAGGSGGHHHAARTTSGISAEEVSADDAAAMAEDDANEAYLDGPLSENGVRLADIEKAKELGLPALGTDCGTCGGDPADGDDWYVADYADAGNGLEPVYSSHRDDD